MNAAPAPYSTIDIGSNTSFHTYVIDRDGRKIAAVWGPTAEKVWTAALLTAAPDLLNGCNALLGLLQIICIRDDVPSDIRRIFESGNHRIEEARAAIAKATGEAAPADADKAAQR